VCEADRGWPRLGPQRHSPAATSSDIAAPEFAGARYGSPGAAGSPRITCPLTRHVRQSCRPRKGTNFVRFGAWAGRRPCTGPGTGLLSRTRVVRSGGSTRVAARDLHGSDRGANVPPPRSRSDCTRGNGVGLSRSWVRCGLSPSPLWWLGPAQYGGGDRTCPVAVDSVEDVEKTCPCPTGRATQQWPLVPESQAPSNRPRPMPTPGAAGRLRWADPPNAAIREPAHGERTCPWPQRGPGGRYSASRPASIKPVPATRRSYPKSFALAQFLEEGRPRQATPSVRQSHLAVRREAFGFLVRWPRRNATERDIERHFRRMGPSATPLPRHSREPTVRRPTGRRLR